MIRKKSTGTNWTVVLTAMIAALPPTLASIAAILVSLNTQGKVEAVAAKVEVVRHATNSLTERLVETTRSDALQEGHTAGVKDAKKAAAK